MAGKGKKVKINDRVMAGLKAGGFGAAGGGVSAGLNFGKSKFLPNLNGKLFSGIKVAVGAVIPAITPKSEELKMFGAGLSGAAAAELAGQLVPATNLAPSVSGMGEATELEEDFVDLEEDYNDFELDEMSGMDDDEDSVLGNVEMLDEDDDDVLGSVQS